MKIIFLSFADTRYHTSLERLKVEVDSFPFTDKYFLTENDIPEDFRKSLNYKKYRRGFGYWKWKSFIVKSQLENMDIGDILFYSDAGIHWNIKGLRRFYNYIDLITNNNNGDILAFQEPFIEKDWTKGDLLNYLDSYNDLNIVSTWQLWGGVFAIRKSEESMQAIGKWYDLCKNKFYLITDKESATPNLYGFIEHRHDQSAFSVIIKHYNHIEIPWTETNVLKKEDWSKMNYYPIHARRTIKDELPLTSRVKKLFVKPYAILVGQYLKYFEHFEFKNKYPSF